MSDAFKDINQLEATLWASADNLRANSKLTSTEYCMPVLGIIFLRHATNRYESALAQIKADQAAGKMAARPPVKADFLKRRALMLPKEARYNELLSLSKDEDLGAALISAMEAIESDFAPLAGQLPKDYSIFESDVLEDLLRVFDNETLRTATGDVFGRIYEYFLMKFAIQGAQDNGEFFTPPSLVQTIVNVIEPDHGIIMDPACGSGGMFVQSSHFIEDHGGDTSHKVTFYGQEKTATTIRLAKMNLAVHGLEGDIREANTFYEDVHTLPDGSPIFGNCDFVMANPPFNVDMVDSEKIKGDVRLPFGLPGVNKEEKVSNANYLWISYFYSYLGEKGRAGFVMSSQASSASSKDDMKIRQQLVETGDVDVMISIRSNFFYTRSVPCELWHFDKAKPEERRDQVLMIDARNIYRVVTRKIYDFSPEQLQNLTAIVWLYRGQSNRFIGLVQSYLDRTLAEASSIVNESVFFQETYDKLREATSPYLNGLPEGTPVDEVLNEREDTSSAYFQSMEQLNLRIAEDWNKPCKQELEAQKEMYEELHELDTACHDLIKDVDLVYKLTTRLVDTVEKETDAKSQKAWNNRTIRKLVNDLDEKRKGLVEQLKLTVYFRRQAHWLLSRFPDAQFVDVPGLCKIANRADIEEADWSLTPGRYVGVAPEEEDEDFDFEEALRDIHIELESLNEEAVELAATIKTNFEGLGI